MHRSLSYPQVVEEPLSHFFSCDGRIGLLYGNASLTRMALYGITLAAIADRDVWVVDGANSFDAYFIARLARGWNYAPESILSHIQLSRAFTCYQLTESITRRLTRTPARPRTAERSQVDAGVRSPQRGTTIFCLGLLDTFYDEDVPLADAVRMLRSISVCLAELARDGHTVFVTAREPRAPTMSKRGSKPEDRRMLMNYLLAAATHTKRIDWLTDKPPTPVPNQLKLLAG